MCSHISTTEWVVAMMSFHKDVWHSVAKCANDITPQLHGLQMKTYHFHGCAITSTTRVVYNMRWFDSTEPSPMNSTKVLTLAAVGMSRFHGLHRLHMRTFAYSACADTHLCLPLAHVLAHACYFCTQNGRP